MKRKIILILSTLSILTLLSTLIACGENNGSIESNVVEGVNISEITISFDYSEVEAGSSYIIDAETDVKGTDVLSLDGLAVVFTAGWDYASYKNGYIYMDSDALHNDDIKFYAEYAGIKSNTVKAVIINDRQVLTEQIDLLESEIEDKKVEQALIVKLMSDSNSLSQTSYSAYNSHMAQCISYGYATARGDWKVTYPHSARIESDRLYEVYNEAYRSYVNYSVQKSDIETEINSLNKELTALNSELSSL